MPSFRPEWISGIIKTISNISIIILFCNSISCIGLVVCTSLYTVILRSILTLIAWKSSEWSSCSHKSAPQSLFHHDWSHFASASPAYPQCPVNATFLCMIAKVMTGGEAFSLAALNLFRLMPSRKEAVWWITTWRVRCGAQTESGLIL